jgi:hypothetical protein
VLPAGAAVRGSQLGGVDFLSGSTGIGITDPQVQCIVPLGPRQGEDVHTLRQTVRLAVSRDGGKTWLTRGAALPMTGTGLVQVAAISVGQVWAASPSGKLLGTSDGGVSWQPQLPGARVSSLASGNEAVWAISLSCPGSHGCAPRLFLARAPRWQWRAVQVPRRLARLTGLRLGGALVPASVLLAFVSRLRGWRAPCSLDSFLADLPGGSLLMLCGQSAGMDHARNFLYRSADGGQHWLLVAADRNGMGAEPPGALPPVEVTALAVMSDRRILLASDNELWTSGDAGRSWRPVPGVQLGGTPLVQINGPADGRTWLLGWQAGLWRTSDGVTWQRQLGSGRRPSGQQD